MKEGIDLSQPSSRIRTLYALLVLVSAAYIIVVACQSAPLTGRTQFKLVPSSHMANLAAETYEELTADANVITSGPEATRIKRIGVKIARAAEDSDFRWPQRGTFAWEFRIIEDPNTVNAWALPGGKVAVYTGIFRITDTDDEIATVLGHEIAHAILEHGNERFSQEMMAAGLNLGAAAAVQGQSEQTKSILLESLGTGTEKGATLPFSRKHEYEADEIGLKLMAAAGYDPRAAVTFWSRMADLDKDKKRTPQILSTHPSHENRIKQLKEWMPLAIGIYEGERELE